jgi:hypothetical protein
MANQQGAELVQDLRSIMNDQLDEDAQEIIERAIVGIELRDELLDTMNTFIESEYRAEFEETISEDEQEQYREFFELSSGDEAWPD